MIRNKKTYIAVALAYLILVLGGILMVMPFVWMISTSLKTVSQAFRFPPEWIPNPLVVDNFIKMWTQQPFSVFLVNSAKISILVGIGQGLTCSMAAYAFARLKFPGRDAIFVLLLSTLMIPYLVVMIPMYLIMRQLGWLNTHLPLIVPFFCGGAFGTFLIRQYFLQLPPDLDDAAKVDGCNPFQIYWKIYLPLSKPALATLLVFWLMWKWNELIGPLIYLSDQEKMTVALGLAFLKGRYWTEIPVLMAASLVTILPIIIIFLAAQKYFVQGIAISGLKG